MRVNIYGMGFVGLTLATSFAKDSTLKVTGVDTNPQVIASLKEGKSHIYEKGIEELIPKVEYSLVASEAEAHIICVGTPSKVTLGSVEKVVEAIRPHLRKGDMLILRSTVPVGTTRKIASLLPQVEVAFAPERTMAGKALEELATLPQIIGGSERCVWLFKKLTKDIVLVSDYETAEMIKLVANCWRAWQFAFPNQLALDCTTLGVDVHEILEAGSYKYPRSTIPSPGFTGGPCLTKDPAIYAAQFSARIHPFWRAQMMNTNTVQEWLAKVLPVTFFDGGLHVGVVGRSFKKGTNDVRDSFCDLLDTYGLVKYDWWDPLVEGGVSWEDVWTGKDVVILAHPTTVEALTAPKRMSPDGIILDLWGMNKPSPSLKVFGA